MKRGFTLIEVMLVVATLGLLTTIAIPHFIAMHERARQAAVKGNMYLTQVCVESYAIDFNGAYPTDINTPNQGFGYYFPDGDEDAQTRLGRIPTNPYTGQAMELAHFLTFAYVARGDNSNNTLGGPNDANLGNPGLIRYGRFSPTAGWPWTEWGIVGSRKDHWSIRSGARIHVLHN